jgi:hypothetical protein
MSEPSATPQADIITHRKYPPIGRCIYCGSDGGDAGLSSEHIIPFSLGGRSEILEASCKGCADITSLLEGHLGQKIFWELRVHTNAPTRHPKRRPKSLPARVSIGNRLETMTLPLHDHPHFIALPVWGMPGIWAGEQPTATFPDTFAHLYSYIPPNMRETLQLADDELAEIHPPDISIISTIFARAIAKIAYCEMVAVYGLASFRRLILPDLILGKYPLVPYFVGSELTDPPPPHDKRFVHAINIGDITVGQRLKLIVVSVRLFANSGTKEHGTPIYRVVVGAWKSGQKNPALSVPGLTAL